MHILFKQISFIIIRLDIFVVQNMYRIFKFPSFVLMLNFFTVIKPSRLILNYLVNQKCDQFS